jgi:hypothetical protein
MPEKKKCPAKGLRKHRATPRNTAQHGSTTRKAGEH